MAILLQFSFSFQRQFPYCQVPVKVFSNPCRSLKIYTKTGDKGTSSLYTGERRAKNDIIFESLGTVDELSSQIGLALAHLKMKSIPLAAGDNSITILIDRLTLIQCRLQELGSVIATPSSSAREAHKLKATFSASHVDNLEAWIDEMTKELPELKEFILPGGESIIASSLHVCRSVCRRSERRLVSCSDPDGDYRHLLIFLNRLSDFFFTAARFTDHKENIQPIIYRKSKIE